VRQAPKNAPAGSQTRQIHGTPALRNPLENPSKKCHQDIRSEGFGFSNSVSQNPLM